MSTGPAPQTAFTAPIVIGLEVHAELKTATKLFCACARKKTDTPNTTTCPICLGHPGTRPVLNKKALEYAIKLCLAAGCVIAPTMVFSRKSYFYPDLSKNFQITQFEEPLGSGGAIALKSGKRIALRRIHVEEDPASIVYETNMIDAQHALIDYNRAGNPLVEIVTEPVIATPAEAREFVQQLTRLLSYLGIFSVSECILKADANVSIKESGYVRAEIKNISGAKEIEKALQAEIMRQNAAFARGSALRQETRGWNDATKTTVLMRVKETDEDYGYIHEPDLCPIDIAPSLIEGLRAQIPELADARAKRYATAMGIDATDAEVLAHDLGMAELFEEVAQKAEPRLAARWLRRELLRVMNYANVPVEDLPFGAQELIEVIGMIARQEISEQTGQKIMERLMQGRFSPSAYVKEQGLAQVSSQDALSAHIAAAIRGNPQAVADYLQGKEKSFHYLLGKVMAATRGTAKPDVAAGLLKDALEKAPKA